METVYDVYHDMCENAKEEDRKCYVYIWYREDCSPQIPFYVGKGSKNRYKSKSSRSKQFLKYIGEHKCSSMIVMNGLTDDVAYMVEYAFKNELRKQGFTLLDGEDDKIQRINAQKEGYKAKKQRGEWNEMGRPKKSIENIDKYKHMVDNGQMTIIDVCRMLGISRNTWKARVADVMI